MWHLKLHWQNFIGLLLLFKLTVPYIGFSETRLIGAADYKLSETVSTFPQLCGAESSLQIAELKVSILGNPLCRTTQGSWEGYTLLGLCHFSAHE